MPEKYRLLVAPSDRGGGSGTPRPAWREVRRDGGWSWGRRLPERNLTPCAYLLSDDTIPLQLEL